MTSTSTQPVVFPEVLKGLAEDEVQAVVSLGSTLVLGPWAVLFRLGDAADRLFIVERGRIALTLPVEIRGREQDVLVEERGPGETVGWSVLVPPHRFTLKATATVPTHVLALPRVALLKLLHDRPEIGSRVSLNVAVLVGHRLQLFQAMWVREMQRAIELRDGRGAAR